MWYKRAIPLILVFTIGVAAFVQEFVPAPWAGQFREGITTWMRIIGGFAVFIGIYSLLHMHWTRIRRQTPGWAYSIFVFLAAGGMIAVGLYNEGYGPLVDAPQETRTWLTRGYDYLIKPCTATIYSSLAFFMASAAFRTFRARNTAAVLMLVAALVVMFGRVPVSEVVGGWLGDPELFSKITDVLMKYPNMAAKRAIMLGISLGAIAQSLRILLGVERSYMGGGD